MSTTALKTPAEHSTIWDSLTDKSKARKNLVATGEDFGKLSERLVSKFNRVEQIIPRNKLLALIGVVILAHILGVTGFINALHQPSIVKPKKNEVIVEFVKPEVIPPPVIEPPKPPPPPPPQVKRADPPPQAAKPTALRTAPADQHIAPNDIVVQENTTAAKTSGPVVADPAPEPAPPPPVVVKEEPLVEAKGGVGHLNNPDPEYPDFAADQGWEGTVVLRVKVLPNGKPADVKVKKSSGHGVLDDAAVAAAKRWAFTPAKRGNTPVEGWATFPVEFKLQ
ncbi:MULTISPECIES: energy transducer TonB [unclassified Methylophilus]|uniref:energy transducer TonB n=1 Tax=unclassified Methylophilus TaxID=2630143 RepID=UPI000372A3CA|nr:MULTISPECIES: energy transducer TonB [unclassified Methylophilus]